MGYTTRFSGSIQLSRALTMAEAKQLLEFNDEPENIPEPHPDSYMQWVPNDSLDAIGWDGNEKFYDYEQWLKWVVAWLAERGISCSGTLYWSGEDTADTGTLTVNDGTVTANPQRGKSANFRPITLQDLGEIALKKLAAA